MRHKARIVLAFELTRAAASGARVRIAAAGVLNILCLGIFLMLAIRAGAACFNAYPINIHASQAASACSSSWCRAGNSGSPT